MTRVNSRHPSVPFRVRPQLESLERRLLLTTFTVTNTSDCNINGCGSLREAIEDANDNAGKDTIIFSIPGIGLHTIHPTSALPAIGEPVIVDGMSQPGFSGQPLVEISGDMAGANVTGLIIRAFDSTVRALVVSGFSGDGIHLPLRAQATACAIGGAEPGAGNIITGNTGDGIKIESSANNILGNIIGNHRVDSANLGNGNGVVINGYAKGNNIIGNIISGNVGDGVLVRGSHTNFILNNYIGTDISGTKKIPNRNGVRLTGDIGNEQSSGAFFNKIRGNIISGNLEAGVALSGEFTKDNEISLNAIGTNAIGATLGNGGDGVFIGPGASDNSVGGAAHQANVIANNGRDGVRVDTAVAIGISQNSIFANIGLGIELVNNGNLNQAAPLLTSAIFSGGQTTILGSLSSTPDTIFTLELFLNDACDGEGQTYVGSKTVLTGASGLVDFSLSLSIGNTIDKIITATAADTEHFFWGNTSKFSNCVTVAPGGLGTLESPPAHSLGFTDFGPAVCRNTEHRSEPNNLREIFPKNIGELVEPAVLRKFITPQCFHFAPLMVTSTAQIWDHWPAEGFFSLALA